MPVKPELTSFERDKLTINPDFDFKNDIAARPFEDLTTNEIGMFKWSGIYHQLQKGFFMLRLRIPGGQVSAGTVNALGASGVPICFDTMTWLTLMPVPRDRIQYRRLVLFA